MPIINVPRLSNQGSVVPRPVEAGEKPQLGRVDEGIMLARFFAKLPEDEAAYPAIKIGEGEPARHLELETPWVEDIQGNLLTETEINQEIDSAIEDFLSIPATERPQTNNLVGIHNLQTSTNVKQIVLTITEGGNGCTTKATGGLAGIDGRPGLLRIKGAGPQEWIQ